MTCKEHIMHLIYKKHIQNTADYYAEQIGVTISCVYKALQKLERLGFISRFKRSDIKYKKVIVPTLFGYASTTL